MCERVQSAGRSPHKSIQDDASSVEILASAGPRDSFQSQPHRGIKEALPRVLGNMGKRVFISGEQGIKGQILRGTGEQREYWGTENIKKQIFDFGGTGEQANLFQGNKGISTPPPLGGPH